MPFRNPVLGGDVLVRTAIKSQNYAADASGWRIARDGSVEFNNGTFRAQLTSGANPGQHVVINSTSTGDPIDVYDNTNALVFSVNRFGVAKSTDNTTGVSSSLQNGHFVLDDGTGNNDMIMLLTPAANVAQQSSVTLAMSPPVGTTFGIELVGGSDDGTKKPGLTGNERGIGGSYVQTDQIRINNLVHMGAYSGITNASGHLIIPHNCSFTPKGCIPIGDAAGTFANLTAGVNSAGFTATNFDTSWTVANTGAAYANLLVTCYVLLWG